MDMPSTHDADINLKTADQCQLSPDQLRGLIQSCDDELADIRKDVARVQAERQRYADMLAG
ncbi:hypothetical protein TRL7639_00480 [Falsiruegeria litorea R37]|uniref:DUF1192 domain-containing protein n=1 Tax=Falsiruegeria litorea R37 TaxID=1200284 RepID=A0A1Y5RMP6_9RHOB|nr:hypothetical protein [Falsiruegeria litorea]SLN20064.1 hypothetical protein TRL7639_00480 [Falsiruegeria litorea R37]